MNSLPLGDADPAEAKAAFHLRMRARGIRDLAVLRAFEIVPRSAFMLASHAELAARDMPLPLPCGQTSHEAWRSALAVEALIVQPTHRVLEIGSGSGYVTAVLAQLSGAVLGLERWAPLAISAQSRLEKLGVTGAAIAWADGLAVPGTVGTFDRVLIHAALPRSADLTSLLAPGGRLVAARDGILVAFAAGDVLEMGACPYTPLVPGVAGDVACRRAACGGPDRMSANGDTEA